MESFAEELKERNEEIAKLVQEQNTNRIAYQTAMDTLVEMTEELTKTKQALDIAMDLLDIAMDLLKIMSDGLPNGNRWKWKIEKALEQITAIEQKDK